MTGMLLAASMAHNACAFDWSDTSLGWSYGANFREPNLVDKSGNPKDIGKNIITFTHSDGYKYGTNFFNVDVLLSNSQDPAKNSNNGATDIFAIYRHNLSMNAVTGSQAFTVGPLRDLALDAGFMLGHKNDPIEARRRAVVVGPNFQFDVPGHWDIALLYYKENNYNGIVGTSVNYRSTYSIESTWRIPFHLGVPTSFEGFIEYIGPKGKNGFGDETAGELLVHPRLMFDVGTLAGHKGLFRVGIGWEYWYNKHGVDHTKAKAAIQSTPFVSAEIHF